MDLIMMCEGRMYNAYYPWVRDDSVLKSDPINTYSTYSLFKTLVIL